MGASICLGSRCRRSGRADDNRWISHAVVLGDGRPYLVALITLDAEETPAFASQHNLKPDEIHQSESMRAEIQTAIDEVNSHYAPVEQIKRSEILPEDASVR